MSSRIDQYVDQASQLAHDNKRVLAAAGITAVAATSLYLLRRRNLGRPPTSGPYPQGSLPADAYDLVIVGAGPSGSTTAYFSAQHGLKVAMLEKESFPRDKYCGDAVCTPAIKILEEMGVMQELQENNEAHFADAGGFVSPAGISYIGWHTQPQKSHLTFLLTQKPCWRETSKAGCSEVSVACLAGSFRLQGPLWKSWEKQLHAQ